MNGTRSPSPSVGRSIDIELSGHEIITVDLDHLDPNPTDLLEVLKESTSKIWVWTKLAAEYWRQGYLEAAERLAQSAIEYVETNGLSHSLSPIYSLLANLQIAKAQKAPKIVLQDARQDDQRSEKPRDEFFKEASQHMNQGSAGATEGMPTILAFLTRAILQLGTRAMDDAMRSFEGVLANKPTNIVALLGKARLLYTRRQYPQALKLFQEVLRLSPNCRPDPRIGIGLCLWSMNYKDKAKAAWQRSAEVNPNDWVPQLLLGLEAVNASKDENQSEAERKSEFLFGTKLIQRAFNTNQRSAAAANALCELFLRKGQNERALKLAERTIQYADTLTVLTEGHIRAARVLYAEGEYSEAMKHYTTAANGQPANVLAALGLAQIQLRNDEIPAAIHTLDTLLQRPQAGNSIEATAMLASLRAHPRPGISSADQATEKTRARELFDRVCKALALPEDPHPPLNGTDNKLNTSLRAIAEDPQLHLEIARLWQAENPDRAERALQEALRIQQNNGTTDPRILNNLAVLRHLSGHPDQARSMYENSLVTVSSSQSDTNEAISTTVLYNLARAYEDQGEDALAKEAYDKLLTRHPEYVDAKIRQAQLLANLNRNNEAHELIKQALSSQPSNLNLRAFYTYFLLHCNMPKPARDFVFATLKDHDKHDLYSLCAAGYIQYDQARETRDISPKGVEERKRGFRRAAEFYEKALSLDQHCAVAAQGLAIVIADDALGNLNGALGPATPDDHNRRITNSREALEIFAKVRESISDGSVYANMGHCYFASDDYDRAIESYETASKKFYNNHNVSVLMCLCRSWYAKATKDQSFSAMNKALEYAQHALHLQPSDKVILYNIAMIQQKAAELLTSLRPEKRSLKDMQKAVEQANNAQKLFASLAADKSPVVPYSKEIADERRKYGQNVLRRCEEHLVQQKQYEDEQQAKYELARQRRQEEKEKQEALERERMEELRRQAEQLAEERRRAREQAQEWTREVKMESDEERERKANKKPRRSRAAADVNGGASGDEANGEPPKKKKRGKLRKGGDENGEEEAIFSGEEEGGDKVSRKRSKKRVVRDDEEAEVTAPRKKQFKSKEYISDSDEEMS
ncbi:RNA polymerase II-associated protein [Panus rudis PR-1116 ss-1]|nr:RNA polymerase II-associated protein [Panus rudis PR-1116 ss-1]